MVGEDLSGSRGQKPSSKNIQVYFGTIPGKAQERVIMFVDRWLATARHFGVMQSQSVRVVAEGKHNMDEADARLIGLDNRLRNSALGLKLLEAAVYSGQLPLQSRSVFCFAGCNLRSQVLALLLKLQLLRIARQDWVAFPGFDGPARTFHQLLLRQQATLQSSDRGVHA